MEPELYVLYVEDSPDDVDLTLIWFKDIGFPYEIVTLPDGAAALDFLFARGRFSGRDKSNTPVLIVLDLNLPKVHGLTVLKKLKADPALKHVLVAVLTSSNEEKDRVEALRLGANVYIQKPVNFDDFGRVVRQIDELLKPFRER